MRDLIQRMNIVSVMLLLVGLAALFFNRPLSYRLKLDGVADQDEQKWRTILRAAYVVVGLFLIFMSFRYLSNL